jgi:Fe(3+) dicitrate transport protein
MVIKIQNGRVNRTTSNGTPGTDANAIKAEAVAAHVLYNLQLNNFIITQVYATKTSKYHH